MAGFDGIVLASIQVADDVFHNDFLFSGWVVGGLFAADDAKKAEIVPAV
jgi:hypothetical protein